MKFKVGDVCVGHSFRIDTEFNGEECVIVGPLQSCKWGQCYWVRWASEDHERYAYPRNLRLHRPPSWDSWLYNTKEVSGEREVTMEHSL